MGEKSKQALRADARRAAREGQSRRRVEQRAKDLRLEDLAVTVIAALAERDQVVGEAEDRAGEALVQMTQVEGLSLREATQWCEGTVDLAEATRLRKIALPKHK
ncbi:hypothetical protein JCM18899A_46340 [Nocardioides sp. AN3]